MARIGIGLVGIGKIARDQHLPAIAADRRFALRATASHAGSVEGVAEHRDLAAMLAGHDDIAAISLCTPPAGRFALAQAAIAAGRHVMLEKPPAATLGEAAALAARARAAGVALFAAWHSREAAGVAPARDWLAGRRILSAEVIWHEDIRRWHPGQQWLLGPGGFGAFDPGINALSILTAILPAELEVAAATLDYPMDRSAPIAARLAMTAGDAPVTASFDLRVEGEQRWTIRVETDAGALVLADGGAAMSIAGAPCPLAASGEYPRLYARFAKLIAARAIDLDPAPLRIVADALLVAEHRAAAAFAF